MTRAMIEPSLGYRNRVERTIRELEPRRASITEIMSSEPTRLERKGALPPPTASTGFRAFNVTDRFPPNTAGTTNVMMGRAPVKSCFFPALPPNSEKSVCRHCSNRRNVPSKGHSRHEGQRSCVRELFKPQDPRARVLLPRKGLSNRSQRSNHSRPDICYNIQACVFTNEYQTVYKR